MKRAGSGFGTGSGSEFGADPDPYQNDQCCGSMTFWGGSGSGSADPCL
jgi:hypothetical protein